MSKRPKINICLITGGKSTEHEVSIKSAKAILKNLDVEKYNVSVLGIAKSGRFSLLSTSQVYGIKIIGESKQFSNLITLIENQPNSVDVFFPICHGTYGEDGCIQGMLEILGKPYVGAGVLGSAIGMDKDIQKRLLQYAGIKIAKFEVLKKLPTEEQVRLITEELKYPLFIKPANLGSSVGVSKANNKKEFIDAISLALSFSEKIIVEEFIDGRELEIGIIGNKELEVSEVGEISYKTEFYDYDSKYDSAKGSDLIIPARISSEQKRDLEAQAKNIFETLECSSFARLDFFMTKDGELIFNEINTLPGFTEMSMFPLLWRAKGLSYSNLLDKLILLALEKYNSKNLHSFSI